MPRTDTVPRAMPVTATPSVVATLLPIMTAVFVVYLIAARRDTLYKEPIYAPF